MNTQKYSWLASWVLAIGFSASAQAALQGRDLNGSAGSYEAYYDTVLDITWLADANYGAGSSYDNGSSTTDGRMAWANATAWAADLSFTDGTHVYDNWRLPTVDPINGAGYNYTPSANGSTDYGYYITSPQSELSYIFYVNLGNPGDPNPYISPYSGCYNSAAGCLRNLGPFSNINKVSVYWSGSDANSSYKAWTFYMHYGLQAYDYKTLDSYFAWAVSSGDVAITGVPVPVPEAETYAMMLAGLGLVGMMARRRLA